MSTEELKLGRVRIISYENKSFESIMEKVFTSDSFYNPSNKSTCIFKNYLLTSENIIYGEAHKFKLNKVDIDLSDDLSEESKNRHNPLETVLRFAIFPNHDIVISSKRNFNSDTFIKMFGHIFKSIYPKFEAEASISYMRENDDIFDIIYNFNRLVEVDIKGLKKSNPRPEPLYREIEEFMRSLDTDVYGMKMVGYNKKGLNRDPDGHIMSAISLSNGGYADKCTFIGEESPNEYRTVNMNDLIISKRVDKVPDEDPDGFINSAIHAFKKFIQG